MQNVGTEKKKFYAKKLAPINYSSLRDLFLHHQRMNHAYECLPEVDLVKRSLEKSRALMLEHDRS